MREDAVLLPKSIHANAALKSPPPRRRGRASTMPSLDNQPERSERARDDEDDVAR